MIVALPVIDQKSGFEDKSQCKSCGGVCCKNAAGIASPEDFGPRETITEVIVEYLSTGFWAVDCWDGDPREGGDPPAVYYVRPAHADAIGKVVDRSWGGVCRLWCEEYGCSLEFHRRPRQCRMLKPDLQSGCEYPDGEGKEASVLRWIDFQEHVLEAVKIMESK